LLCELSVTNAAYPKYPPQPVVQYDGYQAKNEANHEVSGDLPRQRSQPYHLRSAVLDVRGNKSAHEP